MRITFIRHNGGSVWLDELGSPWPKHGCFDNQYPSVLSIHSYSGNDIFGVVVEVKTTNYSRRARIVVHCSDGNIIDGLFDANFGLNFSTIIGSIVVVERRGNNITLHWN